MATANAQRVGKVEEFKKPEKDRAPYKIKVGGQWISAFDTISDWSKELNGFDPDTERKNPVVKAARGGFAEEAVIGVTGYEKIVSYPKKNSQEIIEKVEFYGTDVFTPQDGDAHTFELSVNGSTPQSAAQGGDTFRGKSDDERRSIVSQMAHYSAVYLINSGAIAVGDGKVKIDAAIATISAIAAAIVESVNKYAADPKSSEPSGPVGSDW